MTVLPVPVTTVYDLFDFVAARYGIPSRVPAVPIPFHVPRPLRDLHARFGLLGTKAIEVGIHDWSEGIFVNQDLLVPASRLVQNTFTVTAGPLKGRKILTFVHENQHVWHLHVPIESGDDPPVLLSEDREAARGTRQVAEKLSEFLAIFVLRETVFHGPFLWARSGQFDAEIFNFRVLPIATGAYYADSEWGSDFYIAEAGSVLLMYEHSYENTWIANVSGDLDAIVKDRTDIQQIIPR